MLRNPVRLERERGAPPTARSPGLTGRFLVATVPGSVVAGLPFDVSAEVTEDSITRTTTVSLWLDGSDQFTQQNDSLTAEVSVGSTTRLDFEGVAVTPNPGTHNLQLIWDGAGSPPGGVRLDSISIEVESPCSAFSADFYELARSYDADGDGRLETDAELNVALDDWSDGVLTDQEIRQLIAIWTMGCEIPAADTFDPSMVSVIDCDFSPQSVDPGEQVDFTATVENRNSVPANATVTWTIGQTTLGVSNRVPAGGTAQFSDFRGISTGGDFNVTAEVTAASAAQ